MRHLSKPTCLTRLNTAVLGHIFAPFALVIWALSAANGSDTARIKPSTRTILVLGDSLAAGYGLDGTQAFPTLLQNKIKEAQLNYEIVNAGVSGDTSAGGLRRIDWVLKRKIDVLLLELGGNDGLRGQPVDAMRRNLQTIIDRTRAKYPQVQIIIAGMQMPTNLGAEYARTFQKVFPDLAQKNNAILIPFLLEGVGGDPKLNLPDGIHPTAEGHKIVAENIWKVLRPVLQKASRSL
jgi:acyl-CoA thioesterase I